MKARGTRSPPIYSNRSNRPAQQFGFKTETRHATCGVTQRLHFSLAITGTTPVTGGLTLYDLGRSDHFFLFSKK